MLYPFRQCWQIEGCVVGGKNINLQRNGCKLQNSKVDVRTMMILVLHIGVLQVWCMRLNVIVVRAVMRAVFGVQMQAADLNREQRYTGECKNR